MRHNRKIRICLGIASVCAAIFGYGLANSGSTTAPASVQGDSDESRELVLGEAKKSEKKDKKEQSVIFNDPFIQNKWGLERTNAARAWEVTQGSKDIIVAVIDTGVDINHKDLSENLWVNNGETGKDSRGRDKATNGVDDDGNGYVDDVHGWNFVHSSPTLTDNHGHGTHIAGIIGARGGNGFGISGVAPNVSLMILKYYDPKSSNSNNLKNTIEAIKYAVKMKANIINYSGGGTDYSAEEFAAVKEAEKAGVLFVAAAGNERSNSDESGKHYYPADYDLANIISVTAVNKEETKVLASSNYGVRTVDLAAPGENIYSALPGNSFGMMTGTSQATAFVSGVAALIMAHNREFDSSEVKRYILRNGDEYTSLLSKTGTARLLNSYKALTSLDKGVGLSGVMATNTSTVGKDAFSSSQDIRDPKLNTSALNANADGGEEPAEAFAMFGKEFLKAIGKSRVDPTTNDEIRRR
ncbi:MAG TPA: S8 family peptidase [Bdellovibrionales bacterium]|nr:S8 family peptidase [Bdellovibrionales bacterium]